MSKQEKLDFTHPEGQQWLKGLLHDTAVQDLRITFTKADGTVRKLLCTLRESAIPEDKLPKGTGSETSDNTQRVFDLEKNQWRSFRWDSVKYVEFTI
jgi:hypothetical protein